MSLCVKAIQTTGSLSKPQQQAQQAGIVSEAHCVCQIRNVQPIVGLGCLNMYNSDVRED